MPIRHEASNNTALASARGFRYYMASAIHLSSMKTTTQNHSIVRRAAFACAMLALLAPLTRAADAIKPPIIQSLSVSPLG